MKYWLKYKALKSLRRIMPGGREVQPNKLFVYGILKRGFSLDLEKEGALFVGEAQVLGAALYRIGEGVGLILHDPYDPDAVPTYGEVFEIPEGMWRWLDRIENHPFTYKRELVWAYGDEHCPGNQVWTYVHQHPEYLTSRIESGKYEAYGEYARG